MSSIIVWINVVMMMALTMDNISPVMASPTGFLNRPANDNAKPSSHNIQPRTGTQQNTSPSRARTKPAVPKPFLFVSGPFA